jgi:hypothetical protein
MIIINTILINTGLCQKNILINPDFTLENTCEEYKVKCLFKGWFYFGIAPATLILGKDRGVKKSALKVVTAPKNIVSTIEQNKIILYSTYIVGATMKPLQTEKKYQLKIVLKNKSNCGLQIGFFKDFLMKNDADTLSFRSIQFQNFRLSGRWFNSYISPPHDSSLYLVLRFSKQNQKDNERVIIESIELIDTEEKDQPEWKYLERINDVYAITRRHNYKLHSGAFTTFPK